MEASLLLCLFTANSIRIGVSERTGFALDVDRVADTSPMEFDMFFDVAPSFEGEQVD